MRCTSIAKFCSCASVSRAFGIGCGCRSPSSRISWCPSTKSTADLRSTSSDTSRTSSPPRAFRRRLNDRSTRGSSPRPARSAKVWPCRAAAARVALTERQLERVFRDRAGVTPKQFTRIVRFRKALFAARAGAPLVVAAAESGYADQAHFTREAQALTGCAPRALLPRTGDVASVQDARKWRDVGCE